MSPQDLQKIKDAFILRPEVVSNVFKGAEADQNVEKQRLAKRLEMEENQIREAIEQMVESVQKLVSYKESLHEEPPLVEMEEPPLVEMEETEGIRSVECFESLCKTNFSRAVGKRRICKETLKLQKHKDLDLLAFKKLQHCCSQRSVISPRRKPRNSSKNFKRLA